MILPNTDRWLPWSNDSLAPLDLLNRLRDIHEPAAPGLWPPAPGWWLLALLLLVGLAFALRHLLARQRRRRPLRQALAELEAWEARCGEAPDDPAAAASELAALIKRVALARYPRERVARLDGDDWLAFLDATGDTDRFSQGPGRILGNARYAPRTELDPIAVADLVRDWLEAHLERAPQHAGERS